MQQEGEPIGEIRWLLRRLLFSWQAYPEQGGAILQCQGCTIFKYQDLWAGR